MSMNSNNGHERTDGWETPADLRAVESSLDELAEHDRGSAPARLEQGIFLASCRHLRGRPEVVAVVGRRHRPMLLALAASVTLFAGLVAVRLAQNGGGSITGTNQDLIASTSGLEDDVNFLLDLRSSSDDLAVLGDRIDTLFMDANSVVDSLKRDSTTILLGDGAL